MNRCSDAFLAICRLASPSRGACCGSDTEQLGRPVVRDLVEYQHLPAVQDGHLRARRRRTRRMLILRGHFGSGHEGEDHRGRRPRVRRLDAAAENAARCGEPSALSAP